MSNGSKGPKGYVIARVTVTDPEAYQRYAEGAREAMREHGARILARGGRFEALEGEARPRNVILEFDSFEAARDYWRSETYQAARAHRLGAAEIELCVVEGVEEV
ncbi:DUF1330 domain-containing protein [uncultured Caulobacter sp.]|uniref:DUF1330 domain-containing protein n=1 Tax=uncultured Caulobacter sp. TaxID=158749 RepID=UPI00261264C3|nr:DUF1330 domain-containing protein [uncultured Caulobacter sp.]